MTGQTTRPELYSSELKIGELIAIHSSNRIYIGVFAGRGRINNIQYYTLPHWYKNDKPGKSYLITSYHRVCRFNYRDLNDVQKQQYESLINELIKLKIIKERPMDESTLLEEAIRTIKILREDAEMALNGRWNKSDSGFRDQLTLIDNFLWRI